MPVHRIDTDTSGCLLLARNPKALARFNKSFEERLVGKTYLAILAGHPPGESGTIELSLSKISSAEKGWRMIPARKGKPAVTHWRKLATEGGMTLVEFRPETGRTHQIRVHAASGLGIPLLGDSRPAPLLSSSSQFLSCSWCSRCGWPERVRPCSHSESLAAVKCSGRRHPPVAVGCLPPQHRGIGM